MTKKVEENLNFSIKDSTTTENQVEIKRFPRVITVGIILLILGLATGIVLLVIMFSQPVAYYGESCTDKKCLKSLGLECIDNECKCNSDSYYRRQCDAKKDYMEKCHNVSAQCNDKKNLLCTDGLCLCNKFNYWNGESCFPKVEFDEVCKSSDFECLTSSLLYCNTQLMKCRCNSDR